MADPKNTHELFRHQHFTVHYLDMHLADHILFISFFIEEKKSIGFCRLIATADQQYESQR